MTMVGWGPGACRLYLSKVLQFFTAASMHHTNVYSVAVPPPWGFDVEVEERGGGSDKRRRIGTGVCKLALAADRSCTALVGGIRNPKL